MSNKKKIKIEHWHKITVLLVIYDFISVLFAYGAALMLRFDLSVEAIIKDGYAEPFLYFAPVFAVVTLLVYLFCRMYRRIWRFVSVNDLLYSTIGSIFASFIHSIGINLMCRYIMHTYRMPLSYHIFGAILQLVLVIIGRSGYRVLLYIRDRIKKTNYRKDNRKRIMLIGAGEAGQLLIKDINSPANKRLRVVCIIDDNKNKWKRYVDGIQIAGGRDDIIRCVQKYKVDIIYIAIPSATKADIAEILNICSNTDCEIKKLPGFYKNVNSNISVSSMKNISPEDLLGRDPINADMHEIFNFIKDKVILVTGGGGSIGSELCRQIAAHKPERLIIFDIYENNAYDIQLELKEKYPYLNLSVIIGSVRDANRLKDVFSKYRPDVVYHAAAHKHVPLMEDSPAEAIKNNVHGTYLTAYTAMVYGVKRFVMISTDKAVNPTNIMGASKRLCEMVIQSFDRMEKAGKVNEIPMFKENLYPDFDFKSANTEFVAVRFGNVLGSNGSVVPVFLKQIESGGPVTVTHPDIIRYFMTIPEAVSLVLLAGTYADGGEIFVLDMGQPVKIDTLARNLIKLSGHKPDVDIKVVYTGLRPGEKLYEEKLMAEEGMKKTKSELIHIGAPIPFDETEFYNQLKELFKEAFANSEHIPEIVEKIVPTYKKPVK